MNDLVVFLGQLLADGLGALFVKAVLQGHGAGNHALVDKTLIVPALGVTHDVDVEPGLSEPDKEFSLRTITGIRKTKYRRKRSALLWIGQVAIPLLYPFMK